MLPVINVELHRGQSPEHSCTPTRGKNWPDPGCSPSTWRHFAPRAKFRERANPGCAHCRWYKQWRIPRAKRARYYDSDESEDEEDDLAEEFDPESYYRTNKKLKLLDGIQKYMNTHFHTCLPKEVRKSMARENPLPDIPALRSPETDDVIVDYMGSDFPSKPDDHYKRIQTAVISAGALMLNLWAQLEEQQLTVVKEASFKWRSC